MGLLSIFGGGKKQTQLAELMAEGAIILDVRSPEEYRTGHVDGSVNVPLGTLGKKIDKLRKTGKPIITCCASGMRSASAAAQLRQQGLTAMNGGSWTKVRSLAAS